MSMLDNHGSADEMVLDMQVELIEQLTRRVAEQCQAMVDLAEALRISQSIEREYSLKIQSLEHEIVLKGWAEEMKQ